MDEQLNEFPTLFELDLSSNNLEAIENIPESAQMLHAFSNKISDIALESSTPCPSLMHLGLGFNRIRDVSSLVPSVYPNLISLDLSYNHITDISPLMLVLARCEHLRQLLLIGNPVTFLKQYRPLLISALGERLERLDDLEVEESERALPADVQERATRVMEQWANELFSDQMSVFSRKRRKHPTSEETHEELMETVARRIQNAYRAHKAIQAAQTKRQLMEQCKADRTISFSIAIDSVRFIAMKLSKNEEAAATDDGKGKGGKGGKDAKKGKDDKKGKDAKKDDKKKVRA